jgi:hypothetical protein
LVEAAEHLEAFSRYHLRDLYAEHIQMDELFLPVRLNLELNRRLR